MRDVYRITGNYFLFIITIFRPDSLGRFELTSILLLSMTLAERTAKMFTKDLRSPQKLQVMSVVLGPHPVFCCPLLLKCHVLLGPSWSGITPHTVRKQGQGFYLVPSQRMYCTAPSIWQQSRNLSSIIFAGMQGQVSHEPSGGVVRFLKVPLELMFFILFYNLLELNDTLINCLG